MDALDFEARMRTAYPDAFKPEVIDGCGVRDAAEDVDLSVECSPVLFRSGSRMPAHTVALEGGSYRVYLSADDQETWRGRTDSLDVSADELRTMRARYLLFRGAVHRALPLMPPEMRARMERTWFPGGVFVPTPGSRLAEVIATGKPLSVELKDGGPTAAQVLSDLMVEAGADAADARFVFGHEGKLYAAPLVPSNVPVPVPPPAAPVACEHCGTATPGGICDGCIDLAQNLDMDLSTVTGRFRGAVPTGSLPPPPPKPNRAPVELPAGAMLKGPHGKSCCWWKVNAPELLNVADLPAGTKLCAEHWERVKQAQGGAFRRFGPHRDYVGGRYR